MTHQSHDVNQSRPEAGQLTDQQIQQEEAFLAGIPRLNMGALLGAPIWGPVHGFWSCILFYPLWLLADNLFVHAAQTPTPLAIILSILVMGILITAHYVFMRISVPIAWHRAADKGLTKEQFCKRQRIWSRASIIGAIFVVVVATYYHLVIDPVIM